MASVKEHYDTHLAPLYTWMSGGAAGPREGFTTLLRDLDLCPSDPGAAALDLGAGSGFQALPLAAAGYAVTAVDLSEVLLAELSRDAAAASLGVRTIIGDLRDIASHTPSPAPEVIVCMGDTLTHLSSLSDVARLLQEAAAVLAPGGYLLLSFRDYTVARQGADRFIPVRSDANRIFTCFLDFAPERISVHDIIQTREGETWRTAISVYEKLRLSPAWVEEQLLTTRLKIVHRTNHHGLVTIVARQPSLS